MFDSISKSVDLEPYLTTLRSFLLVLGGFGFGVLFCLLTFQGTNSYTLNPTSFPPSGSLGEPSQNQLQVSELNTVDVLTDIAANPFSCNSRAAYEQLTRLYSRRISLEARKQKGEANRDRIAVIARKTHEAEATEGAFRKCIQITIPGLLKLWEEDLAKNLIRAGRKTLNDELDKSEYGLNMDVLEEVADAMEFSVTDS